MYKCKNSFISSTGRRFNYGDKISSSTYNSLRYSEQWNFEEVDDDIIETVVDAAIAIGISSLFSSSSDDSGFFSDNDGSSFDGFDGGDFGGGGAGGDW